MDHTSDENQPVDFDVEVPNSTDVFNEDEFNEDELNQIQIFEDEAMEEYELLKFFEENPFSTEEILWSYDVENDEIIYNFENQIGYGSEQPPVDLPYVLQERSRRFNRRFQAEEISFNARINPSQIPAKFKGSVLNTAIDFLKMLIKALIEETTQNLNDNDLVRFCFLSDHLDKPISTCLRTVESITVETILSVIMKVLQSKDKIPLDDPTFRIEVIIVKNTRGGGKRKLENIDVNCLNKRSIITIPRNEDNLCCARAIVVGKASIESHPQYHSIRDGRRAMQKRMAEKLHEDAEVPLGPCGFNEIRKFENFLNIQIHVVSSEQFNKVVYKGPNRKNKIFLYYHDNNYDLIKSMKAFLCYNYYCSECDKGFDHVERHKCNVRCNVCFSYECKEEGPMNCSFCNRRCKSEECFRRHRALNEKSNSFCDQFYECPSCEKFLITKMRPAHLHQCFEKYCTNCKDYFLTEHLCFLKKTEAKKGTDSFIFFDFETDQESSEHVVNFAMAMYSDGEEFIFKGYNALNEFCAFLFSPKHKGFTAIAHNMRGFDGQFVLGYLLKQGLKPSVIPNGSKVMKIELPSLNIRIIDSYNFLPMSLSKLPKTFGITELCKGYFPHLFNIRSNQDYVGTVPDKLFFGSDMMSVDERLKFLKWYEDRKKEPFDFQKEITMYCRSDVDILKRCCLLFRTEFLAVTDVDPFQYVTIASAVMATFRSKFIEENTIAMIPAHGYVNKTNQSTLAVQWLDFVADRENISIQHAFNKKGEIKIGAFSVDGYCRETNTVYEFQGCFYHGCERCYPDRDLKNPVNGEYMWRLWKKTKEKRQKLESLGVNYVEIWEHEFAAMKCNNTDLKRFLEMHEIVPRLDPRDSFFGGRTNTVRLYHEGVCKYVDFTSLYPYVNKYCRYPIKHPEIITENFENINSYFGIVKCSVLPPRKIYLPVLPYRSKGKLTFPLCRLCVETRNQTKCEHNEDERALTGTWVTEELKKALDKGYKVLKIHEIYHFKETRVGLFAPFIDAFLKIKQESSGYPSDCVTEESKREYIKLYKEREGVDLDKEKISINPGRRQVAKLCLNSFWGRFGMCENKTQLKYIIEIAEFNKMMTDATINVTDLYLPTDDVAAIHYCWKEDFVPQSDRTNIFIATFTTAWARLKLYEELEKLGENVLYFDTDSIIYASNGENDPVLGPYLGEFTDELDGKHITVFVSGGPKNYAYERSDGVTCCKIKGFTLNYRNSSMLNFQSMKDLVKDLDTERTITTDNNTKICTDLKKRKVFNKPEQKKYRLVYDKRVVVDNYKTVPYGY